MPPSAATIAERARTAAAATLKAAPVQTYSPPLSGAVASRVAVGTLPMRCIAPVDVASYSEDRGTTPRCQGEAEAYETVDNAMVWVYRRRRVVALGEASLHTAAVRAHVAAGHDYGPVVTVRARVQNRGQDALEAALTVREVSGPLSAVRQALPDTTTLNDWRAAGVVSYPIPREVEVAPGVLVRKCDQVALADAPIAIQVEMASRQEFAMLTEAIAKIEAMRAVSASEAA